MKQLEITPTKKPYMTKTDIASKLASDNGNARIARGKGNGNKPINITGGNRAPTVVPHDKKEQNKLIDECYEFVMSGKCEDIDEFPISKKMSPYRFKKIANENPYFAEVLELCMYTIGNQIQKEWRHNACDKSYARDFLWMYKKDYKETRKEISKAEKNEDEESHTFVKITYEKESDALRRERGASEDILAISAEKVPEGPHNSAGE